MTSFGGKQAGRRIGDFPPHPGLHHLPVLASANGSVNPCTEAAPCENRSLIARRVGSDKAANVVPNRSTIVLVVDYLAVSSADVGVPDFCSLISE